MGSQKTKLMRGDRFGLLLASELAAEMIGDYERGRPGATELRVESLDEAIWDDVVRTSATGAQKWQVKRQTTAFDSDDAGDIISSVTPGQLHHFAVAVLVAIKTGVKVVFELSELRALCEDARMAGLDAVKFCAANAKKPAFVFAKQHSGAGASDQQIAVRLASLQIDLLGTEQDIRARASGHLRDVFTNADELVKQLHNFFLQCPDGQVSVDINLLYAKVVRPFGIRDPARGRWIHLHRSAPTTWEVRGPLSLAELVDAAWLGQEGIRTQLASAPFRNESVTAAVSRLVLHQSPPALTDGDGSTWSAAASELCGATLGIGMRPLPFTCHKSVSAHPHPSAQDLSAAALSQQLSDAMDAQTWRQFTASLSKHLVEDTLGSDLRDAMIILWDRWAKQIASPTQQAALLRSMLATAEECKRSGFDPSVRSGRLLVEELATGMMFLLAVGATLEANKALSVALTLDGSASNVVLGSSSAHLIAVGEASNPRDRVPCRLTDDPGQLLAAEVGIAILPRVEATPSELYELDRVGSLPFHASEDADQNYQHQGPPVPVLTASISMRRAMREGIVALQTQIRAQLQQTQQTRVTGVDNAISEAVSHG